MKKISVEKEWIHYELENGKIVSDFPDSKIVAINYAIQYSQSNELYEFINQGFTKEEEEKNFQLMAQTSDDAFFRTEALKHMCSLRGRIFQGEQNMENMRKDLECQMKKMQKSIDDFLEQEKLKKIKINQIQKLWDEYSQL